MVTQQLVMHRDIKKRRLDPSDEDWHIPTVADPLRPERSNGGFYSQRCRSGAFSLVALQGIPKTASGCPSPELGRHAGRIRKGLAARQKSATTTANVRCELPTTGSFTPFWSDVSHEGR